MAEFGVVVPQTGAKMSDSLRFARRAEEAGFDSVWLVDHLIGFPAETGNLEPWTLLTELAAATERVGVGALVLCQSFRNPALLAKMSTTLDNASGGRLRFLIGAGWYETEYVQFGYDFPPPGVRVEQLTDTVRICRGMWTSSGEPFTYEGKQYAVRGVQNVPPPDRAIPIGIGGAGKRMLNLTAREADEWNCPAAAMGALDKLLARLKECEERHGRQVRRTLQIAMHQGEGDPPGRLSMFNPQLGLVGSKDRMVNRVGELSALGFDGFFGIVAGDRGLEGVAEVLADMRAAAG